jgi:large subunit ribosomal protein L7/L12
MTKTKNGEKTQVDMALEAIEALTVTELAALVGTLKEKFGITQAAFTPQSQPAVSASAEPAAATEEQTEFTVGLASVGDKKIQVLKELRALTNLGLKEAKDIIDKTPSIIKEGATKEEADRIKAKLEEVGAKVEVK